MNKDFPTVKFVEVPVTKENAYLHQGLGIPSLPFAHIYQTASATTDTNSSSSGATLVEEMKINKHVFADFARTLGQYVNGECAICFDDADLVVDGRHTATSAIATTGSKASAL
jgi:hypothetical protein